jgi:oxygen-independent coproporphyrinogen-3 oxidase
LIADLASEAERVSGRELISIFLGGGTPSLFRPQQIARLLDAAAASFNFVEDIEITMEANPGTVECGDPAGYLQAGVNRLSVGAQSFDTQALKTLGRIHSVADIRHSVDAAVECGFSNINVDIMFALPGQNLAAAMSDIEQAADLGPTHISWYQLTLEPNTVFHARPPAGIPDDDAAFEIQQRGQELLAGLGFEQYEVSAYARDGRRSAHNLNYWTFGDYLGVGAGAHGKISVDGEILRYSKTANPQQYMKTIEGGESTVELMPVSTEELVFEFMLNAVRLTEGFDESLFGDRTGLSPDYLRKRLLPAAGKGLIEEIQPGSWRTTARGGHFLNNLQAEFLPE